MFRPNIATLMHYPLTAVMCLLCLTAQAAEAGGRELVVTSATLEVNFGRRVLRTVKRGRRFPLEEKLGAFCRVALDDDQPGGTGWIHKDQVSIESAQLSTANSETLQTDSAAGTPAAKALDSDRKQQLAEAKKLGDQALALYREGKRAEALPPTRRTLKIYREVLGTSNATTSLWMNNLARLLRETGDLQGARSHYEELLVVCRKTYGEQHARTAETHHNLGLVLDSSGETKAARTHFEQALAIRKKLLGEEHLLTAEAMNSLGLLLKKSGELQAARPYYERALAVRKKLLGERHGDTVTSLNNLGMLLLASGDYTAARSHLEEALEISRQEVGEEHAYTARMLHNLAELLQTTGDNTSARKYYEQALAIRKKVLGEAAPLTLQSHNSLGDLLRGEGDHAAARMYYEQALSIAGKVHGAKHPYTAAQMLRLGDSLVELAEHAAAQTTYEEALSIYTTAHGEDHADTAATLSRLAVLLQRTGAHAEAREHFERAHSIRKKVLGAAHPLTLQTLNWLAGLLQESREYSVAIALLEEGLAAARKTHGEQHRETAVMLCRLGELQRVTSRYSAARESYTQAVTILRSALSDEHVDTAAALNSFGQLLIESGDYEEARTCIDEALAIRQKVLGDQHLDTAASLNNQALLLHHSGDLAAARDIYERCLEINMAVGGEQHPATSNSLHNLGSVYWAWGNYQAALRHLQRAVTVRRSVYGEQSSRTAISLNNLGLLLHDMGDYPAALEQHEQALAIRKKIFGDQHAETARSHSSLAGTLRAMGRLDAAREHYERALEILKSTVGVRHRNTAASMDGLAGVLHDLGDFAAAQQHYEQSVIIYRTALGDRHFRTAGALMRLGEVLHTRGDLTGAAARYNESRRIVRQYVAGVLPSLSQAQQLQFLSQTDSKSLHQALSLGLLHREQATLAELSAGWLLNGKAVAHEALAQRTLLARASADPEAATLVDQLNSVRDELARMSLNPPGDDLSTYSKRLQKLQADADGLTRQLASAGTAGPSNRQWVELRDVRSRIPASAALIEMVRFRPFNVLTTRTEERWQPARYAAWIVPAAGAGDIRILDLGEAEEVEAAVRKVRAALEQSPQQIRTNGEPAAELALRKTLTELSQLILKPLLVEVGDAKQLILSPDALLWLVPWSALLTDADRYAVEDYQLSFVVSGRDLVKPAEPHESRPPLILADPEFGPARPASTDEQRGLPSLANLPSVRRLPATAAEAAAIRPRIERYAAHSPVVYTGSQATESAFRRVHRPEVLTFSTHVFFLPDQVAIGDGESPELPDGTRNVAVTAEGRPLRNPLLRCGLLLAGCNQRSTAGTDADDGVLTGLEIVGTDLRGTRLVVLSACETGLGDVRNGEGVAGLRQAFQLAGAESVVATLWQVPDRDTARLMVDFFDQLADGKTRAEALREAQVARMQSHRNRYGAAHPFFWAAVTLTGQWK